ncbi:MAG: glycosyltransferase family 2 protein, partial [Thermodesulfobacteriota bacterium]
MSGGADAPEVSIAIVTCNGRALLEGCLASLREQDYPCDRVEILVYDNASRDGTREWLAAARPDVRVVGGDENLGFALPCNRAVAQAAAPLVCLVNNDMRFARSFLRELVAGRTASGAVCVGARILTHDGSRLEFDGGTMNFYGHGAPRRHGTSTAELAADEAGGRVTDTLFASGGAMLVERDAFLRAGGFDEDYFAYFEDVDLGWRLWARGERCVHAPAARAFHREHASEHLLGPDRRMTLLERNALLTIYKNYERERGERVFRCALALLVERARLDAGRAAACLQGLREALELLPRAELSRRELAARRVRQDRDIVPLFGEPWRPPIAGDTYAARQREL